jgi:hypothetical protein
MRCLKKGKATKPLMKMEGHLLILFRQYSLFSIVKLVLIWHIVKSYIVQCFALHQMEYTLIYITHSSI